MAILDYSTKVPVARTAGEIQDLLARSGARCVMIDYDRERQPVAIGFVIQTPSGHVAYRLPANVAGVEAALATAYKKGEIERRFATHEQATRTAWRVIKVWLEAQLALIEAGMAELPQIMLPYSVVDDGRTLYETWAEEHKALPVGRWEE
ncbi:MAG: hypothetical protein ACYC4L_17925 [Chloroflexota bacterium]